jgi:apocytochrome f
MATNKFFKSLLFALTIAINSFGFCVQDSSAYPVFAQQNYSNPRAANGKLACANCHLNQKAIEVESPQAVLPNSVFEVEIKVPYDTTKQQVGANGKQADLNVGGILILPKGFKLASKNQISEEIKAKNKGVFISPYSTEFDNILVVGPISGNQHQEISFPIVTPNPELNKEVNFLKYPIYVGANRGRGQINPTGEKTNNNTVLASAAGKVENITLDANGNYEINIKNSDGVFVTQSVPKYYELNIIKGQLITLDQPITKEPNVGGFGQTETEIVLQSASRIYGYIAICFVIILKSYNIAKVELQKWTEFHLLLSIQQLGSFQ